MLENSEKEAFISEALFLGGLSFPSEPLFESLYGMSGEVIGFICPVTQSDLSNANLIATFCLWRNESRFAYPTRFEATPESTQRWMSGVLSGGHRVLFKLMSPSYELLGHIGLAWNATKERLELDSVQRGGSGARGLMSSAVKWVENYAQKEFNSPDLHLRVLGSNEHAVEFYLGLGYSVESTEPVLISETISGQTTESKDEFLSMVRDLESSSPIKAEILTAGPSIGFRERLYAADAVQHGWNQNHSDYLRRLQDSFATFVGSNHALATSSCTGALHLAFASIGIGPGDEVIVPAVTWVATASAVAYTGATPVFVDVDPTTWTLDPLQVQSRIRSSTKAIVAVHLYGFLSDVSQLRKLADSHGIYLVEDAAPAIGATLEGRMAGTFGHFGCYSFQGAKLLVAGEGGMLVTDSPELYARAVKFQEHGRKPGTFWIEELGYKYKMSNLTASLALGQLERAKPQIFKKRKISDWYRTFLRGADDLHFQEEMANSSSIHWMTSIKLSGRHVGKREELTSHLKTLGIDTRPVFPNISKFTFWGSEPQAFPAADAVAVNGINLPSGVALTRNDVEFVAKSIRAYLDA